MTGIYIGSTSAFAGKNITALALGLALQKQGLRVGYMKPVGALPVTVDEIIGDEDAMLIREVLGLDAAPDELTPVIIPQNLRATRLIQPENCMERIRAAYERLSRDKDVMLVCGSGSFLHRGKHRGVDGVSIVRALGLKTILVDRFDNTLHYDAVLSIRECLGDSLLGVLFNDVPELFMRDAVEILVPYLSEQDIKVLGIIPRDPLLNAIKASELAWRLGGKIISGNAQSQRIIEDFLIGTMQVENFMTYFRRQRNSATIVGGDRTDLQLVALEGDCPCLILTGNIAPNELVRARSEQKGVPVIQVKDDTYTVAKQMETILASQKLRELVKIERAAALVNSVLDLQHITQAL
ncbi:DRTGG domain-containing protein [Desulfovibrio mangrovi]|uniref:phosphotransacetylase family protein n=1 Tax=Desulfovibrio mangrovi TaxID=2976983 RepID=UPI00224533D1|nr:DRTGG domain-containing protein [Desulfovibrio mangrovi]UZP66820.1 DRTGG domain-containing protein [Desulfovibrio mangrovi]